MITDNIVINALLKDDNILSIALGGSRSRNIQTKTSDYDLFCIIKESSFNKYRDSFTDFLENIPGIKWATFVKYLEYWGYLYKAIDGKGIEYDISILPPSRIHEMSIRSTNVIIKDTYDIYENQIQQAQDYKYEISHIERSHYLDYIKLFFWEYRRLNNALSDHDYWYSVRCLERLKTYYIRCDRIQNNHFSKKLNCPEKGYHNLSLKDIFIIDGDESTIYTSAKLILEAFKSMINDSTVIQNSEFLWKTEKY